MPESVHPCRHCGGAVAQTDRVCSHCFKPLGGKHLQPPGLAVTRSAGMILCIVLGSMLVFLGVLFHSEATRGVAFLTFGCFLGICARIAQAGQQHREHM